MSKTSKLAETSAQARSALVVSKIRAAMELMELEIAENDGVYISGRLSLNEVCRRAGVHPITMQGSAHKTTTKPMVIAWLEKVKNSTITGKRSVRAEVTKRARNAEDELRELAAHFQLRENEIPRLNEENALLTKRVQELEAEILRLQVAVSEGRVVQMPKRKR